MNSCMFTGVKLVLTTRDKLKVLLLNSCRPSLPPDNDLLDHEKKKWREEERRWRALLPWLKPHRWSNTEFQLHEASQLLPSPAIIMITTPVPLHDASVNFIRDREHLKEGEDDGMDDFQIFWKDPIFSVSLSYSSSYTGWNHKRIMRPLVWPSSFLSSPRSSWWSSFHAVY